MSDKAQAGGRINRSPCCNSRNALKPSVISSTFPVSGWVPAAHSSTEESPFITGWSPQHHCFRTSVFGWAPISHMHTRAPCVSCAPALPAKESGWLQPWPGSRAPGPGPGPTASHRNFHGPPDLSGEALLSLGSLGPLVMNTFQNLKKKKKVW